jgi:hypothetical protein
MVSQPGKSPALIGLPALLVAVPIGVTTPCGLSLATKTALPSGVTAIGPVPATLTGLPAAPVAVRIGITVSCPLSTYATGPRASARAPAGSPAAARPAVRPVTAGKTAAAATAP